MPILFTWNKSDLQRACHPLTPRRRSHFAKFRFPRIWPSGALGVLGETSLCPSTVWQLLCWQLPLEPSSKKMHVGITHTCQPRAWVGDEHPSLLWALTTVLLCTPRMLPAVLAAGSIPPGLVVEPGAAVCNLSGCFACLPPPPPASTLAFFTAK